MTAPPDLSDPRARAAYRRELRGVGRPVRWLGVALALLGLTAALAHRRWPQVSRAVAVFLVAMAALHLLAAAVIRRRYHRMRMRG